MRTHGLKVLGLVLVAALGLMALMASSALAVNLNLGDEFYSGEAGKWLVSTGVENPPGLVTRGVAGKQINSSRLLILGKSVEIVCAKGEITTALVENEYENFKTAVMKQGGHAEASLQFKECKVQEINAAGTLTGIELKKCTEELNKATTPGQIGASVLVLVKKHETTTYLVIVPIVLGKASAEADEALTAAFTTIKFGGICTLPETIKVTGSLASPTPTPVADALKPILKLDSFSAAGKAEQTLLGAKLKFGANEAFVQGEGEVELPTNPGVPWGAM
jgi:hypothetical protein